MRAARRVVPLSFVVLPCRHVSISDGVSPVHLSVSRLSIHHGRFEFHGFMSAADLIVLPALVLACVLVPLYLSLREVKRDAPGSDPSGGTPVPDRPTPGDSVPVDPEAVQIHPSPAPPDRKEDALRRPVG
jgi:hypothetical protein